MKIIAFFRLSPRGSRLAHHLSDPLRRNVCEAFGKRDVLAAKGGRGGAPAPAFGREKRVSYPVRRITAEFFRGGGRVAAPPATSTNGVSLGPRYNLLRLFFFPAAQIKIINHCATARPGEWVRSPYIHR